MTDIERIRNALGTDIECFKDYSLDWPQVYIGLL